MASKSKRQLGGGPATETGRSVWEDFCFNAQQAAEKAIKVVLTLRGVDFPKSHDIAELLTLLSSADVPDDLWDADSLTEYAVVTRYPGRQPPVFEEEYRRAVTLAEWVVSWAGGIVPGDQE